MIQSIKLPSKGKLLIVLLFPNLLGMLFAFGGVMDCSSCDFNWTLYGIMLFCIFSIFVYLGMRNGFPKQRNLDLNTKSSSVKKFFPYIKFCIPLIVIINLLYLLGFYLSGYIGVALSSERLGDMYSTSEYVEVISSGPFRIVNLFTLITLPLSYFIAAWVIYYKDHIAPKQILIILLFCSTSSLVTLISFGSQATINYLAILIIGYWIRYNYRAKDYPYWVPTIASLLAVLCIVFSIGYLRNNANSIGRYDDVEQSLMLFFGRLSEPFLDILIQSNYSPFLFSIFSAIIYLSHSWTNLGRMLAVELPLSPLTYHMGTFRIALDSLLYFNSGYPANFPLRYSVYQVKSAMEMNNLQTNSWYTILLTFKVEYGSYGLIFACAFYGFLLGYWFSTARLSYWNFILGILSAHFILNFWMVSSLAFNYFQFYLFFGVLGLTLFKVKRKKMLSATKKSDFYQV